MINFFENINLDLNYISQFKKEIDFQNNNNNSEIINKLNINYQNQIFEILINNLKKCAINYYYKITENSKNLQNKLDKNIILIDELKNRICFVENEKNKLLLINKKLNDENEKLLKQIHILNENNDNLEKINQRLIKDFENENNNNNKKLLNILNLFNNFNFIEDFINENNNNNNDNLFELIEQKINFLFNFCNNLINEQNNLLNNNQNEIEKFNSFKLETNQKIKKLTELFEDSKNIIKKYDEENQILKNKNEKLEYNYKKLYISTKNTIE